MACRIRDEARHPLVRVLTAGAAVLGMAVLLAACDGGVREPLRVGLNPWPGYEMLHLAEARGFFAEEAVPVTLVELSSTGDVRRAFERGQVDVTCTTNVEVLLIRHFARPETTVFYVTDFSNGSDMLIARAAIPSVGALRGRRIGIEGGTLDVVMVAAALESAGMTLADVTLVPMPHRRLAAALAAGEVDAIQTYPPASAGVVATGAAHRVFDSSMVPGVILDVMAADAGFVAARGDDLARLVRAFERARAWAAANPVEAQALMAKRQRIHPEDVAAALAGVRLVPLAEQLSFLVSGGKLEQALRHADVVLRRASLIDGADRTRGGVDAGMLALAATR